LQKDSEDKKKSIEEIEYKFKNIKIGTILLSLGILELVLLFLFTNITISFIFFIILYPFISLSTIGILYIKNGLKERKVDKKRIKQILFGAVGVIIACVGIESLILFISYMIT